MQNATQEQINASPISKQLWCIQFPDEDGGGMGVVKMKKEFLSPEFASAEKTESEYIAQVYSDYAPEEPEVYKEFQMNGILDTSIVSIAPNIYLFLEALFENKSKEVQDYHFSVYKNNEAFISSDKNIINQMPSLKRTEKPFVWSVDEDGFITNHLGHKFLNVEEPLLGKFISLACSQYYSLSYVSMQNMMRQLGAGDFVMFGGGSGGVGMGQLSDKTRDLSYEPYLEMKKLVEEMKWDIHGDMFNLNSTLASEY